MENIDEMEKRILDVFEREVLDLGDGEYRELLEHLFDFFEARLDAANEEDEK